MLLPATARALALPWATVASFRSSSPLLRRADLLVQRREADPRGLDGDQLVETHHTVWPYEGERLLAGLRRFARRLFRSVDQHLELVTDGAQPGLEILKWRQLSLELPAGLLITAGCPEYQRPSLDLRLLPVNVVPVGPLSHLHLHAKVAGNFELLWAHVAGHTAPLVSTTGPKGLSASQWQGLLVRALLARQVLSCWGRARSRQTIAEAIRRCFPRESRLVYAALGQLVRGETRSSGQERRLWRWARPARLRRAPPETGAEVWERDPTSSGEAWPEGSWGEECFTRLLQEPSDGPVERLFVQYLRVKCFLYGQLMARTPGLAAFVETFGLLKAYRRGLETVMHDSAAQIALPLGALEYRVGPMEGKELLRLPEWHRKIRARSPRGDLELGWVIHFHRTAGGKEKARATRAPRERARRIYRTLRPLGFRTARFIQRYPHILSCLRGLDLAGLESRGPLWVAAPVIRRLREVSRRVAAQYGVPSLRLTLHVGEDFEHLATGLRSVHEPVLWGLVERGDRLGHAMALGVDVSRRLRSRPRVSMSETTRIFDLAWLIDFCRRETRSEPSAAVLCRLDQLCSELEARLRDRGGGLAVRDLGSFHRETLGGRGPRSEEVEAILETCLWPAMFSPRAWQLALDAVELDGRRVEVDAAADLPVLEYVQRSLFALVERWQLTIEVNPSSNLLIGELDAPLDQPMFRLHPLNGEGQPSLPICVSADDPLLFATNLEHELAYAWAGLVVRGGVRPSLARAWLEEAARVSWAGRFTRGA